MMLCGLSPAHQAKISRWPCIYNSPFDKSSTSKHNHRLWGARPHSPWILSHPLCQGTGRVPHLLLTLSSTSCAMMVSPHLSTLSLKGKQTWITCCSRNPPKHSLLTSTTKPLPQQCKITHLSTRSFKIELKNGQKNNNITLWMPSQYYKLL